MFPFSTPPDSDAESGADGLLDQAPVLRATMGPIEVWLALSYAAVRQALTDPRFSREAAMRPGSPVDNPAAANPYVLSSIEGKRHTRVRRLMAQAFTPRMVERLEPRIQSIVDDLLDALEQPADLVAGLTGPLPTMMICELLGASYADAPPIRDWTRKLLTYLPPDEQKQIELAMLDYLAGLVREKRANPDDRIITALVAARDDGEALTEDELLNNLLLLLSAGHETTVNQLGNSLVTLLRHPEQLRLLRDDPALIGTAIDELMRYCRLFSAALPRVTTEALELDGVPIAEGEGVLPVISVANRDPKVFADPNRLDITREPPMPHIGFGHGPHFCLGAQLARLEMRVAITSTLKRFPGLRLEPGELTYHPDMVVRSLTALPVTWS